MVNNNPDDLSAKIAKLSEQERKVLELRCQGLDYKTIHERLFISVSAVKQYMSRVYVKLGLDLLPRAERMKFLYETFCPLLKELAENPILLNAGPGETANSENEAGASEPVIPPYVPDMVDEDEYPLVKVEPAPLVVPIPNRDGKPPRRLGLTGLILGVVLGICLGGVGVYLFLRPGIGPIPFTPQPTTTIPSQAPVNTMTAIAAPPSALVNTATATPAPTNTSAPTLTEVPPTVSPPTNTPFVPPADGILFQDNFDNGWKSDWNLGTDWITSNGALTQTTQAAFHNYYSWATLNKPEWKNYILSVKIIIPYMSSAAQSNVAVAVRVNGQTKYLGVQILPFVGNALFFIGNSDSDSDAVASSRVFDFASGSTLQIEANGNNITVSVDGRQAQQVSISGYDTGGIALGIDCLSSLGCPSFDNVKVTYLP